MLPLLTAAILATRALAGGQCWPERPTYSSAGGEVRVNGSPFRLKGTAWFGMETETHAPHGLWSHSLTRLLDFVKENGFNALRLPFSVELVLTNPTDTKVDCDANGHSVCSMDSLTLMGHVIDECAARGILVVLDQHRIEDRIEELWYTDKYPESKILQSWDVLMERFGAKWNLLGLDLKNEPHGAATWGHGVQATDVDLFYKRVIRHVADKHPQYKGLFFVEGVQENARTASPSPWAHFWGGNVEGVRRRPISFDNDAALSARVVYSPHVYGPDVHMQDYFGAADFPANMAPVWRAHFGFAEEATGRAVVVGEWGGHYKAGTLDRVWQDHFARWLVRNCMNDQFYWCLNPNSGDTGGLLEDDWTTADGDKLALLRAVQPDPSMLYRTAGGEYCLRAGGEACGAGQGTVTSSEATTRATRGTAGGGSVCAITSTAVDSWVEGGRRKTHVRLAIENNSAWDILCPSATIGMRPATTRVDSQWNMTPVGAGRFRLPAWLTLAPGQSYGHVGLVVVGDEVPSFALAENGEC